MGQEKTGNRPTLLTVVCILSYIGGGIRIVFYSVLWAISGAVMQYIEKKMEGVDVRDASFWLKKIGDASMEKVDHIAGNITSFLMVSTFLSIISVAGVFFMWKMQLKGFYLYTGAQLFLISSPYIIFNIGMPSLGTFFFSSLMSFVFIILYAIHLKKMEW